MSSLFGIGGGGNVGAAGFYPYSIDQSLRFDDGSNHKLTRTPSSAGNRQTWSVSMWVKRSKLGVSQQQIFEAGTSGAASSRLFWYFNSSDKIQLSSGTVNYGAGSIVLRDVGSWYHLLFRATGGTVYIYVNGVLDNSHSISGDLAVNSTVAHNFFSRADQTNANEVDGYLAQAAIFDGTAYTYDQVTETKNGILVPKDLSSLSFGTNGVLLEFGDSSAIGDDTSGNTNDFTATNLAASDVVTDSPTDNAVTWDYNNRKGVTLSEGNLYFNVGTSQGVCATMPTATTGKWYFEFKVNGAIGPYNPIVWGFSSQEKQTFANYTTNPRDVETSTLSAYTDSSTWQVQAKESGTLTTISPPTAQRPAQNSIIGIAYDADTGKAWMSVNNVWLDSSGGTTGNPSTGANPTHTFTSGIAIFPAAFDVGGVQPQGILQADDDVLTYTPPTDFLTIKSSNLPEPTIGPNSDTQANDYFNTILYTGDGTTSRSITGVGFAPDFVWGKCRSNAEDHILSDTVRGANKKLESNNTGVEDTSTAATLSGFESDGFTGPSSTPGNINVSGRTYVAWNWKAGGTAVSNTDGSITSSVSANQDAGFSVVSYTGTGSAATVGHGLSSAPEMVIVKQRSGATGNWFMYHKYAQASGAKVVYLNLTNAAAASTPIWNNTQPTDTVFSLGTGNSNNAHPFIAYCFHSVEGHSKVGSYVGNANADGTFVHTGFRPAFVMIKGSSFASNWFIQDYKRDGINVISGKALRPNLSNTEDGTTNYNMDFLSNGFKLRTSAADSNTSGATFIYLAIGEASFKYSNAR